MFKSLLSAPFKAISGVAKVVNIVTEKVVGDNLDIFDIEGTAKEIAEEIEDD